MNPESKQTHLHNGTTTTTTTDESIFPTSCYDLTDLSEALGFVETTTTTTAPINYPNEIPLVDTNPTLDVNHSAYDLSELRHALSATEVAEDKKRRKMLRLNLKRRVIKICMDRKQKKKQKKKKVVFAVQGREQSRFLLPTPDSDDIDAVMAFIEDLTQTSVDDLFNEFLK